MSKRSKKNYFQKIIIVVQKLSSEIIIEKKNLQLKLSNTYNPQTPQLNADGERIKGCWKYTCKHTEHFYLAQTYIMIKCSYVLNLHNFNLNTTLVSNISTHF